MSEAIIVLAKALGAGLCMGIGAIGPALGEGNAVSHALATRWMVLPVSRKQLVICVPI